MFSQRCVDVVKMITMLWIGYIWGQFSHNLVRMLSTS